VASFTEVVSSLVSSEIGARTTSTVGDGWVVRALALERMSCWRHVWISKEHSKSRNCSWLGDDAPGSLVVVRSPLQCEEDLGRSFGGID
jgi:hypothetical protein